MIVRFALRSCRRRYAVVWSPSGARVAIRAIPFREDVDKILTRRSDIRLTQPDKTPEDEDPATFRCRVKCGPPYGRSPLSKDAAFTATAPVGSGC